jgi:two-component system chemotaxis sensor kinase CheA
VPQDQYRYFRIEALELLEGLSECVLEFEKGERGSELVSRLLRLAHTLKGASRVVKQSHIASLANSIEEVFVPLRETKAEIPPERINEVLGWLDVIAAEVASLDKVNSPDPASTNSGAPKAQLAPDEFLKTVRIEIGEIDSLLDNVSEAFAELGTLRRKSEAIGKARQLAGSLVEMLEGTDTFAKARTSAEELRRNVEHLERSVVTGFDQVEAEFLQVRDAANGLRLRPITVLNGPLERAVRDAAQSLAKEVRFVFSGADIRFDTHVLASLRDALFHVVRNAVAHGIELPAERITSGKEAQGTIELRVERRGNCAVFTCSDNGRGIDVGAVRRVAVGRGLVSTSEAASLGMDEAVNIIMKGGITTAGAVDEVSGRGIGLDVVRETTARLHGTVLIRSTVGRGTSLEINVPISVTSLTALHVDVGDTIAAIPLGTVRRALRVMKNDVVRSTEQDSILYDGSLIPFLSLKSLFGVPDRTEGGPSFRSAIVLDAPNGVAAIGVDRVLGAANVIMRPLTALTSAGPAIAGASLDSEGNPQLVLDPAGLVNAAHAGMAVILAPTREQRPCVLVIDDSLTTRMLEQSILESAGYEVELATSAEEGLEKAHSKRYGLFLVDVEMPGMDGFEFIARTRSDAILRTVPAILVTSRDALEDRRHGKEVGAYGYIIKSEFDQGYLLSMLRDLIG